MKKIFFFFFLLLFHKNPFAQVTQVPVTTEQQLENITENNEDAETEDDSYLQDMTQFQKDPVNLNSADENTLKDLKVLSALQIQNLVSYRKLLGNLLDIYELQAVPGWDLQTISKARPFITVGNELNVLESIRKRISAGEHSLLLRFTQVLERSRGYLADPVSTSGYYPGSPQKLLLRYKYVYKNLLEYGIVAEKDAGEQFFKGSQQKGFDFYSAHIFIRDLGIIKSFVLGDFAVNLGQGLTQWQGLAFKKGPDITSIKRQSAVLRPYNSAGEIYFHRGAGISIGKNNWEITFFGSYRKLDANFVAADSLTTNENFVSSLQTSGYHRTKAEQADKGIQEQIAFGGNVAFQFNKLHIGVNGIHYRFKYPLIKDKQPYNSFVLKGKDFGNYSAAYSYTFRNMHIFGELASSEGKGLAFINGLLISVSANVDMSFLYRNISKEYQSLYTNAFTENAYPTNEKGLFSGISIKPAQQWQIDAYVDLYKFPWLKFGVNSPSSGSDYFIQISYRPSKQFELYTRYKIDSKGNNFINGLQIYPVLHLAKQNWRTQFNYKINRQFTIRSRVEMGWSGKKGPNPSSGFLIYTDLLYKPMLKPFSANIRLQYFETDSYNSRLYAYENDVLYSFSVPVFYDKGYRYYLNINYDFTRKMSVWARVAQTVNPNLSVIGSGLDEIRGNRKTEVKLELLYKF